MLPSIFEEHQVGGEAENWEWEKPHGADQMRENGFQTEENWKGVHSWSELIVLMVDFEMVDFEGVRSWYGKYLILADGLEDVTSLVSRVG